MAPPKAPEVAEPATAECRRAWPTKGVPKTVTVSVPFADFLICIICYYSFGFLCGSAGLAGSEYFATLAVISDFFGGLGVTCWGLGVVESGCTTVIVVVFQGLHTCIS